MDSSDDMSQTSDRASKRSPTQSPTTRKSHPGQLKGKENTWKLVAIVTITILAAAIGAIVIGISTDKLHIKFGNSSERPLDATPQVKVCDNDVVQRYNDIITSANVDFYTARDNLHELRTDVEASTGWNGDPTCWYVMYWDYQYVDNIDGMKEALKALKQLNAEGLYVNNAMYSLFDIDMLQRAVDVYQPRDDE
jgi:hypothetical protein